MTSHFVNCFQNLSINQNHHQHYSPTIVGIHHIDGRDVKHAIRAHAEYILWNKLYDQANIRNVTLELWWEHQ